MNKIITITAVLFAVIIGLGVYVNSTKEQPVPIDASQVLEIAEDDHVSGDVNADVVFVEYLDMQCPACAAFHPVMDQVKAANPDIAFVTRHFPLYFHRNARAAGASVEAGAQQGKFEEMVTLQFADQQRWSPLGAGAADEIFEGYAQQLGLDMDAFNDYRNSDSARNKVSRDYDGGVAFGVNSTPTFILQGEQIRASSVEEFQQLIDAAKTAVAENPVVEEPVELEATTTAEEL